jgi:hypothetical protein
VRPREQARRHPKPAQIPRLEYVVKFKFSIPYLLIGGGLVVCAAVFLFVVSLTGCLHLELLYESWDNDLGRNAIEVPLVGIMFFSFLVFPLLIPRKILLFEHEWRVKFWLWRSKVYRYEDLREIREERFWKLLFSRRIFASLVLHWGLWRKGVYLRTGKRFAWFFRVRDNAELMKMLKLGRRGWTSAEQPKSAHGDML